MAKKKPVMSEEQKMLKKLEALGYQLIKRQQINDHVFNLNDNRFNGQ